MGAVAMAAVEVHLAVVEEDHQAAEVEDNYFPQLHF